MKIDMSSEAIAFRLKKVSELRKLCMALKLAGRKKDQNSDSPTPQISSKTEG
ncbi:MAG TPA: hypothetical protein PL048_23090 [Leptospiraceae bacterium]|nr:hypothetical protein [Leptospiraceae bacterium]HMZ61678.1 hypothetical protein [Leptospiraceae bacterium]HNF12643.1 hypothetical protein [Leptospiraceae bacterium]HNF26834.1 hypothetical protein [Leptospiraceae bacterium]HNI99388.1 hypothetical protein [Leptospiraceae bacterium]